MEPWHLYIILFFAENDFSDVYLHMFDTTGFASKENISSAMLVKSRHSARNLNLNDI